VKPADLEQRLHLHQLHQRCELMSLLTQLYCGPDPSTSASCHALHTLASPNTDASEAAAEQAEHAKSLLQELQALRWPECSEERLLQLLKLLGEAVFVAGSGAAAGSLAGQAARAQQQQLQAGAAGDSQAANLQQLGEALVGGADNLFCCSFFLCIKSTCVTAAAELVGRRSVCCWEWGCSRAPCRTGRTRAAAAGGDAAAQQRLGCG
jgi:hypothetical protein